MIERVPKRMTDPSEISYVRTKSMINVFLSKGKFTLDH
jgi:hypothetical protein